MRLEDCPLTERQRTIMELVCKGYTNSEIAGIVFCAESTLKHTLAQYIYPKLRARNKAQAAALYALNSDSTAQQGELV